MEWDPSNEPTRQKASGAYYTPDEVVRSLIAWAVRKPSDRLLDPSCGDGRFLAAHENSVGVEQDPDASVVAHARAVGSLIHQGDFFSWAAQTKERFDCAAGNPPFIRYQRFAAHVREAALKICAQHGAIFSRLSSSWAPFLVATATLLKSGGRMAFIVPAEIGHAPYAAPVLEYLTRHFDRVQVIGIRERLFAQLSEDCWLLFATGYGGSTKTIAFSALDRFEFSANPPRMSVDITVSEWKQWNSRLRPFLLPSNAREMYMTAKESRKALRLGNVARIGIGYVTGANDFFHLRPSQAEQFSIPFKLLHHAVRNGKSLAEGSIDETRVKSWLASDEAILLLHLAGAGHIPHSVRLYLDSKAGRDARETYKCRNRDPWYMVPDVTVPDGFLSYMSGKKPNLVSNRAQCVHTNSVLGVRLTRNIRMSDLIRMWNQPITALSCEIEGHPLGGGMLKIEPGEAARVLLEDNIITREKQEDILVRAISTMRQWRHYDA